MSASVSRRFLADDKGYPCKRFFELLDRNEGWIRAIDSVSFAANYTSVVLF